MTTLLIPYGLNADGRIVHVDDVPRGKACGARCASCDSDLVAKKGKERIHHFAHYQANHGCEGWLHKTAKRILAQRIGDAMVKGASIPIGWSCQGEETGIVHEVDLLGKRILNNVSLEQYLPTWNIRPDITLMAGDTPQGLIEVVDTSRPKPPVLASGLPVLEVHVSEGTDLEVLEKGRVPVAVKHNYPCPDPEKCRPQHTRPFFQYPCPNCAVQVVQGENAVYTNQSDNPLRDEAWYCRPCYAKNQSCKECGRTITEARAYTYTALNGWRLYNLMELIYRRDWLCVTCYFDKVVSVVQVEEADGFLEAKELMESRPSYWSI